MSESTGALLAQAEAALADNNLAVLLPFALELEPRSREAGADQDIYGFFKRAAYAVLHCGEPHISLFASCLNAVCAKDPVRGAIFLEDMLVYINSLESAASSPPEMILH